HAHRYHRHYHTTGHVLQGGFKAFPIQDDDHLLTVLRDVERNPVRAELVAQAEHWKCKVVRLPRAHSSGQRQAAPGGQADRRKTTAQRDRQDAGRLRNRRTHDRRIQEISVGVLEGSEPKGSRVSESSARASGAALWINDELKQHSARDGWKRTQTLCDVVEV